MLLGNFSKQILNIHINSVIIELQIEFFLNCNIKCNTFLKGTGNKNSTITTTVYDISCQYIPASLQEKLGLPFYVVYSSF